MSFWNTYQSGSPKTNYVVGGIPASGSKPVDTLGPDLSAPGGSVDFDETNGQNTGNLPSDDVPKTGGLEPNPNNPVNGGGYNRGGINPGGMYNNRRQQALGNFWRSNVPVSTPNLYSSSAKRAFAQTARAKVMREMNDFSKGFYGVRGRLPMGAGGPAPVRIDQAYYGG